MHASGIARTLIEHLDDLHVKAPASYAVAGTSPCGHHLKPNWPSSIREEIESRSCLQTNSEKLSCFAGLSTICIWSLGTIWDLLGVLLCLLLLHLQWTIVTSICVSPCGSADLMLLLVSTRLWSCRPCRELHRREEFWDHARATPLQ